MPVHPLAYMEMCNLEPSRWDGNVKKIVDSKQGNLYTGEGDGTAFAVVDLIVYYL